MSAPVITTAVLLFAGAIFGVAVIIIGVLLGFVLAGGKNSGGRIRKRKRRRYATVVPVPSSAAEERIAPPGDVKSQQASSQPLTPPPLDDFGRKALELHGEAVRFWQNGEHESAYGKMQEAFSICAQNVNNPWLHIELCSQMLSIACGIRRFDQAIMLQGHIDRLRSMIPADAQKESRYMTGDKIDNLAWMIRSHLKEMEASQEALHLHQMSGAAMAARNFEDALNMARQALEKAIAIHGPAHWLVGVMYHGVAQVHMLVEDLRSARDAWRQAREIFADWQYAVPEVQAVIDHNLKVCEQALGDNGSPESSEA
jgi:hypothetical protein